MTKISKANNVEVKNKEPQLKDGILYTGNKGPAFGVRNVQVGIMAIGLGIAFSYRTTFSIAILGMTDNSTSSNPEVPTYDWDNKSFLLSAIYWSAICLPLVSGYLGKQYGPKWFILGAGLLDSLMFFLIPFAAKYCGFTGVLICRLLEGLAQGMIFPLNMCIMGNWAPAEERSKMGFFSPAAVTVSIIVTSIGSGYISESFLGWPWIFHIFGALGFVWCALFGFLAEQSPATHPKITSEERTYIQVSLNQKSKKNIPTPWKKIFTSIHFWAILVAQVGANWVAIISLSELSIFMNKVMKYGAKSNGVISALPSLCGIFSGTIVSFLSDYIPRRKILSVLNSRRFFQTTGIVGISCCFLMMTFVPVKHSIYAVALMCLGNVFAICSTVGGSDINALDISPKFAGIIFGCYSTFALSVSFVSPFLIEWIITDESDATQWRTVFTVSAVIAIGTTIFFDIFATATRQSWDGEDEKEAEIMAATRKSSVFSITGVAIP